MRIGLVTERLLTGFGVDLTVDILATGLSRRGHDVTVYCAVEDGTYSDRPYRIAVLPTRASRFFPLSYHAGAAWAPFIDDEGLDVVQVHTFPFFGMLPALETPTVAVDYGVSSTVGMPWWLRADFAYVTGKLYGRDLPAASRLVTISEFLRARMPAELAARTEVIPLGGEHYWRTVPPAEVVEYRAGHGVADDAVLGLYVGRLKHKGQPYKGVAELLENFRALRAEGLPVELLCVGFGDASDAAAIRAAGAIPVTSAPASEMARAYAAADIFLTASKWEGFGLPLLEAQYFGLPSVAYGRGAHPEVARAGETAELVATPAEFVARWRELVRDPERRARMGEAAARFARGFSWERAVDAHEVVLRSAAEAAPTRLRRRRSPVDHGSTPLVSAVVLTYEPEAAMLARCLDSLTRSDYPSLEVVLVDNGSSNGVAVAAAAQHQGTRFIALSENTGFAAGVNRGVAEATGSLCLILNPDAEVEPDAVRLLVDAATRRPEAIGFAPKMLFAHDHSLIDAVGTAIDSGGAAFNLGIGQMDIGQFDTEDRVFGLCFGAAMIRREAFGDSSVGPLDPAFFMYYEDVDWSLRATLSGNDFWTVPAARVYHVHSASTRGLPYDFKYYQVERNLMFTVHRDFERLRAARILVRRTGWHVKNALKGHYRGPSLRAAVDAWRGILVRGAARRHQQRRRRRPDAYVFQMSMSEAPHFDPVRYSPLYDLATLLAMSRRMPTASGDARWQTAYDYLSVASRSGNPPTPAELRLRLVEVLDELPAPLLRYLDSMAAAAGA